MVKANFPENEQSGTKRRQMGVRSPAKKAARFSGDFRKKNNGPRK